MYSYTYTYIYSYCSITISPKLIDVCTLRLDNLPSTILKQGAHIVLAKEPAIPFS